MRREIYKIIEGFPTYKISNFGNIISFNKQGPGSILKKTGRLLKPSYNTKKGKPFYQKVALCEKGKSKTFLVHRLVAITFIPNPESKKQVNHMDGDKTNNNVNNLEWCTGFENNRHASSTGLRKTKISFEVAEKIRKEYLQGDVTQVTLSRKYEISRAHMNRVVHSQTWEKGK